MDKLKYIKLENEDGSYSDSIPLAVDSDHVDVSGDTLTEVLETKANNSEVATLATDLNTQKTRIDNLAHLDDGSTTGDAELIDGRTDYEGISHANIGNAIRGATENLNAVYANDLDIKNENAATEVGTAQIGYCIGTNGKRASLPGAFTNRYTVVGGEYVHIEGYSKLASNGYGLYAFYAANDWSSYIENSVVVINGNTAYGYWNLIVKVPNNAKSIQVTNSDSEHPLTVKTISYKRYVDDYTTIDNLSKDYVFAKNPFIYHGIVNSTTGKINRLSDATSDYLLTPYLKIDKTQDIVLYKGYQTSSGGPLVLYDKDLNFVTSYRTSSSAAAVNVTVSKNEIPETAYYMIAQGRVNYELDKYLLNGDMTLDKVESINEFYHRRTDEKLYLKNIFCLEKKGILKITGKESDAADYVATPYVAIDKTQDIVLSLGYETTSTYSPLCLYDKDLNLVQDYSTGTPGTKSITITAANIPENAYYMRATGRLNNEPDKFLINGGDITFGTLTKAYNDAIEKLQGKVSFGELFNIKNKGISKSADRTHGKEKSLDGYCCTPYIKVDLTQDIVLTKGYETTSTFSPLCLYDENLNVIQDYSTGSSAVRNITIEAANIPEGACYMRATAQINTLDKNLWNGDITLDKINYINHATAYNYFNNADRYLYQGDYFYIQGSLNKGTGKDSYSDPAFCKTPFIKIDKTKDIVAENVYESPTAWSPLCIYDKDLNLVHDYSNGTAGLKTITITPAELLEGSYYFRASGRYTDSNKNIQNGEITFDRLNEIDNYQLNVLNQELEDLKDKYIHDVMAVKYENAISSRENYLRQLYKASGETPHWYGAEWTEVSNGNNVTGIYSTGDASLLENLPIHNLMRRCIYKDNEVVYYLDANNSELKEDGTAAVLDGTDGNVMVEIPEFFYKVETTTENDVRKMSVKISQQGLDGFTFSPKMYVAAYESTVDHNTNRLVSVCTTLFTRNEEEVKIKGENNYIVGTEYSLGTQKTALRSGFTENAAQYRGGTNDENLDQYTDPTDTNFCRNQLGLPLSFVTRKQCLQLTDPLKGELIYQYDVHKILFYLSMIEFRGRIIQEILGKGATVYPDYDAYEFFFKDSKGRGQGGLACLPCGITNSLGNGSGQVYYKMPQVPVTCSERSSSAVYTFDDVWMPCMSYRGIEHYYGHLYKICDQITITSEETDTPNPLISNKNLYNVSYYYQKNPFQTDGKIYPSKLVWKGIFTPNICCISEILGGYDGHVLPILTANSSYQQNYGECAEYGSSGVPVYIAVNGRIVSGSLVGRNFIVAVFAESWDSGRANDGTRLMYYDGVK